MITNARPIAIRRSRVQTRISLRRECAGAGRPVAVDSERSLLTPGVNWLAVAREDDAGAGVSGDVEVAGCFSSCLSIFRRLVFIAWPSRPARDAILPPVPWEDKGRVLTHTYSDSLSRRLVAHSISDT